MTQKKTLPNAEDITSDEGAVKAIVHFLEQLGYSVSKTSEGHYNAHTISITQDEPDDDGDVRLEIEIYANEKDTGVPAEPHNLGAL